MKTAQGKPCRLERPLILRATLNPAIAAKEDRETVFVNGTACRPSRPVKTPMVSADQEATGATPMIHALPEEFLAAVGEGDILGLEPDGGVNLLWDASAHDNAISLTPQCNSRCIICPQKPQPQPRRYAEAGMKVLSLLRTDKPPSFGITGGEPTMDGEGLVALLELTKRRFPDASVQLLTNGRRFSDFEATAKVVRSCPSRTLFCIPLYADNDVEHDAITDVEGSFAETIAGIHHLVRHQCHVEIRVVMVRQNVARLEDFAHFLFWNLPFAVHIAFMALETSGIAADNLDRIWVEPKEYAGSLERALVFLQRRRMNTSIYNIPLCLLPERLRPFARDSISSWKKIFLPVCRECCCAASCAGFFATSSKTPSSISPLGPGSALDFR